MLLRAYNRRTTAQRTSSLIVLTGISPQLWFSQSCPRCLRRLTVDQPLQRSSFRLDRSIIVTVACHGVLRGAASQSFPREETPSVSRSYLPELSLAGSPPRSNGKVSVEGIFSFQRSPKVIVNKVHTFQRSRKARNSGISLRIDANIINIDVVVNFFVIEINFRIFRKIRLKICFLSACPSQR